MRFVLRRPLAPGENVIPTGARMAQGEVLLEAGEVLGPQALGILAGTPLSQVRAHRRPTVALLALGDELVDVGGQLDMGQVRLTNLHVLAALVRRYGGLALPLGVAPDDPERIRAVLAACLGTGGIPTAPEQKGQAAPCDLLLTLGGSHKGDFDYVHAVLERLGASLRFDRIRMTPGGSTIFALLGGTMIFGLPGTPSAAWAAFETLVRPALWKLAGRRNLDLPRLTARLAGPLPEAHGRAQFVACRLDLSGTEPLAYPIEGRHPHEAPAAPRADGLIRCLDPQTAPEVGARIEVDWLSD